MITSIKKHVIAPIKHFIQPALFPQASPYLKQAEIKVWWILSLTAACLLFTHYLKYRSSFIGLMATINNSLGLTPHYFYTQLRSTGFFELSSELWWWTCHLIGFFLVPAALIKYVFKQNLSTVGLQLGDIRKHAHWYIFLAVPIVVFAILASFRGDFINHYPFYSLAHRSWLEFLIWECMYLSQFFFVEFFFRGFLLLGCYRHLRGSAIFIMLLPYLMLHFQKPWLEASGAILFGFLLGVLAIRSRSIWGGVAVHISIALTMDIAAMIQKNQFPPNSFLP